MNIVDKRSFKGKRLKFQPCCGSLYLFTKLQGEVVNHDHAIQIRGNTVIHYGLPRATPGKLQINKDHRILQTFHMNYEGFGVVHTDNHKLYVTLSSEQERVKKVKTFDLGGSEEVQLFDGGIAYKTKTGNWQIIASEFPETKRSLIDSANNTQFKDKLREKFPFIKQKDVKQIYGVYSDPFNVNNKYVYILTDRGGRLFKNGSQISNREYTDEIIDLLKHGVEVQGHWLSSHTFIIRFGDHLYETDPLTVTKKVGDTKITDGVDYLLDSFAYLGFVKQNKLFILAQLLASATSLPTKHPMFGDYTGTVLTVGNEKPLGVEVLSEAGVVLSYDNYDFEHKEPDKKYKLQFKVDMMKALSEPLMDPFIRKLILSDPDKLKKIYLCEKL